MFALDILNQYQSTNGTLLAAGKLYIYKLGRSELATVYGDHNGEHTIANPVRLDDQGMAEIYLNNAFNYTVVACDAYGAEQFSRDIFPRRMGDGESIGTQLYEGISPICVNNDVFAISANTSRLGVQEPLYFVKDDEEETIIGFSGQTIPEGVMSESALGFENNKITGYNGSAFSAGLNYSAGANIVINGATIALDSAINLLDAQGAKAVSIDATEQQFTNLTSNNGSILDASGLYVSDLNMENAANLSKDGLYVTGTGSRISMSNDMSDIYGDNHFGIYGYQESGDGISAMHLGGNDLIVEHGENHTITASYSLTGACSSAQSALNIINSSDLTQYSAGANIDITDHVISGKDWSNEINDASANAYNQSTAWTDSQGYLTGVDLSEYAKTDFVVSSIDAATSGKYDTSSFSAISGSFLTAHQSLPQSADWNGATTIVNNNSAIWNSTTNVVSSNSASWGASNPQIPVTGINGIKISESGDKVVFEVSADYATHDDLTSKQDSLTYGYHDTAISSIDSSALYDSSAHARINTLAGRISDLSSNKLDESAFSDVSGDFATTGDINDLITSIAETYQSTAGMTAYQSAGDYYSASNPSGFISEVPAGTMNESAFGYDSDNKISSYNGSAFAGGSYQPSGNYIPYTAVDSIFNAFKTNSGLEITTSTGSTLNTNFINTNYINLRYINSNLNINNQSILSNGSLKFQTKSDSAYVDREKIHKWDSASDYIQNSSATINEVNTNYQTNSGIYLTAHQDLSDYQTTAGMTAYLTAVPDTYLQNTDLSTTDGKVTAISGIPLSAGGDVPEGVMVESGLEYNAVNEISGYNGSAIAQYGAEKQWLQHDDTLVHAANSAQYALGVNLSAVAQLLGVDETVLFSGAGTSAANITEDIHNFNTVQLHIQHVNYGPAQVITLNPETMNTTGYFAITRPRGGENLNVAYIKFQVNQTGISAVNSKCIRFGTWSNTTATGSNVDVDNAEDRNSIIKVIGIGRKQ